MTRPGTARRVPRDLHPGAWWAWAVGMGVAATRTSNPLVLALVIAVVGFVVSARRTDAPWARGFGAYLALAFLVVALRVVFRMVFAGQHGTHILFTLPEIPLPERAGGIRIGGPVSLEGVLAAVYDGLRLATLLICLGAANLLANPKRLLRSVPSALYEVGTAVTVALSVAPQLVESGRRVLRARRLRGDVGRRTRWFRQVAVPVMTDALDRSLALAAAMESRGYGRTGGASRASRRVTGTLMIGGLGLLMIGVYGVLDATAPRLMAAPALALGALFAVAGIAASGARVQRTRYRADRFRLAEWGVAASGIGCAAAVLVAGRVDLDALHPPTQPLRWPELPPLAVAAAAIGLLAAAIAPPPLRSVRTRPTPTTTTVGVTLRDVAALRGVVHR